MDATECALLHDARTRSAVMRALAKHPRVLTALTRSRVVFYKAAAGTGRGATTVGKRTLTYMQ